MTNIIRPGDAPESCFNERKEPQIALLPLSVSHVDDVMKWVNDPAVVKNFQNFMDQISREAEIEFINTLINSPNDRVYSIFNQSGDYVGQVGINQISWPNRLGRLSIFITKSQQHKGYGRAAILAILEKAFNELALNKVWLIVFSSNVRSINLYERVGFLKEGELLEEYFWQNTYHDMTRMGILKRNWLKAQMEDWEY